MRIIKSSNMKTHSQINLHQNLRGNVRDLRILNSVKKKNDIKKGHHVERSQVHIRCGSESHMISKRVVKKLN